MNGNEIMEKIKEVAGVADVGVSMVNSKMRRLTIEFGKYDWVEMRPDADCNTGFNISITDGISDGGCWRIHGLDDLDNLIDALQKVKKIIDSNILEEL